MKIEINSMKQSLKFFFCLYLKNSISTELVLFLWKLRILPVMVLWFSFFRFKAWDGYRIFYIPLTLESLYDRDVSSVILKYWKNPLYIKEVAIIQ